MVQYNDDVIMSGSQIRTNIAKEYSCKARAQILLRSREDTICGPAADSSKCATRALRAVSLVNHSTSYIWAVVVVVA